ncbi:VCBS repeat-containing protein [Fibrella aquatilis]|uniref:VCBS repeat-containing protein n=1 Tax=Fibrella aquatilis TaxID=2817059 RepID=A0A939G982_9BACT|nr:VCBS repeat-containing protein [Fibrella aquatilis]MBO0932148.1 VCBS repeat-containing protein [Fibrella aquatilis]
MTVRFSLLSFFLAFFVGFGAISCRTKKQFQLLSPSESGITFGNALTIRDTLNIIDNELIYNGAGVSVADWNGDGLTDIFFTANMEDNALYLNRGSLNFEDITKAAGVSKPHTCWSAGSTVVDINADGKLDLYVSNMLYGQADLRRNLLYVNQGNDKNGFPTFREMGHEYGLDSDSYSAQTAFFDYDNDGDLDAYILVNQMDMQFANQYFSKPIRDASPTADRLLRNDFDSKLGHAVFIDVSEDAGIQTQGYGHGISVIDINQDGWQDLYVTNDYLTNDNLFINERRAGSGEHRTEGEERFKLSTISAPGSSLFTDYAHECLKHQSWSAMGNDVADINNDGLLDMIAMDMLPDINERKKALIRENSYAHYQFTQQYGYDHQHIRNTLQLNRGLDPQTGLPCFSDVSQMAGVNETDWSWCPLWFDADNDGYRDLLITNGFPKDISDQDFLAYRNDATSILTDKAALYRIIPEVKIANYMYRNRLGDASGDTTNTMAFANKTADWGFDTPTFSNGAAYADFDNDGDVDVVINNTNDYAHLYENHLNDAEMHPNYLRIKLVGPPQNLLGLGAKVTAWANGQLFYAEQSIVRGYLSTSEATLHLGLGSITKLDSVRVVWPMGTGNGAGQPASATPTQRVQLLRGVAANQVLTVSWKQATEGPFRASVAQVTTSLTAIDPATMGIDFQHVESDLIDFNMQKTLPHKFSSFGPALTTGDVNGDGRADVFVGGSSRVDGSLLLQQANGHFSTTQPAMKQSGGKLEQDAGVLLFDADGDGDNDLYCVRGGYLIQPNAPLLQDALYVNDGRGNFRRDSLALPRETANGRVVRAADLDKDGDLDLFVGGSVVPKTYPKADRSYLLRNDSRAGQIRFTDVTAQQAPELLHIGIINDAQWADLDRDTYPDLLLAGEWMPITLLRNAKGKFTHSPTGTPDRHSFTHSPGWWTSLCVADFDKDGDLDIVAGNYGLNTAYHASEAEPLTVHSADFDGNGTYDAILAQFDNNRAGERHLYPYHSRDDLIKQTITFRRRFLKYEDYGKTTFEQLLPDEFRQKATVQQATQLASCYIENRGGGQFHMVPLPIDAQYAPIMTITATDLNRDGLPDLILAGNDFGMEVFQGRADAGYGLVLLNAGRGRFRAVAPQQSGFMVPGDARGMVLVPVAGGKSVLMVSQKRDRLRLFSMKN